MVIILGLYMFISALRGILRRKYIFWGWGVPRYSLVLEGGSAVAISFIHGVGAILITTPFIVQIIGQWPDSSLFITLFFSGIAVIAIGFILGGILFRLKPF